MSRRKLEHGTEVSIIGERGRFRFVGEGHSSTGKVFYNFIGGPDGHEAFRSFTPDRVKRVHRINRTRANGTGKPVRPIS